MGREVRRVPANWQHETNRGLRTMSDQEHQNRAARSDLEGVVRHELHCPQCGEPTEELHEGYCEECCNQNQAELDRHNAEYDHWNRMNAERREEEIRRGCI